MIKERLGLWKIFNDFVKNVLILCIEMQWYYQHEPLFNGVYSKNNLPKNVNNGAHVINLHFYDNIEAHWVAFYVKNDEVIYFKSFSIKHILKEV